MTDEIRLRFAPSPTGYFHVGGARTALYNWLVAKKSGGQFILRIDDTDEQRNKDEWTDGILAALGWLEITFDEGPYFQSQRKSLYSETARRLFESGLAYFCSCTREEIDERARLRGGRPGYDGFCRDRGLQPKEGYALRFKVPDGETIVDDQVRGRVVFSNSTIEDFILLKGNGAALYVLANFVDDVDLRITHVIRAEEHLPTTPKAVLLYQALGLRPPVFAHLPVLVNEKRVKLSKRRDRVAVEDFRDQGFLPEAMVNYLALLGWSPGDDVEFLSREEMLDRFDLSRVSKAPAFFDVVKMTHFNKHYIMIMELDRFVEESVRFLESEDFWTGDEAQRAKLTEVAPFVKERIALLSEVVPMVDFLFADLKELGLPIGPFSDSDQVILSRYVDRVERLQEFRKDDLESEFRELGEELSISLRKLQAPIRLAVTGRKVGPPLFVAMEVLGRDTSIRRIKGALGQRV
ncbi:glutamyl-tRNA synthetase [Ferrithrix thermotolerans DSM 19514]|uniref:Glutamate--tRNA ligase n=1 Tax=Ferrithrix thermotolerans DSM 19514 TaxID=1121881 RepID=A0A1M4VG23_9ACTN|nr:glutamate--tRNA ligase [Ferrithrix thermotolerans]SHE67911.1 glutamyl-tRNA synthetase [Ferrithrix thermotolerans DSM 19514]